MKEEKETGLSKKLNQMQNSWSFIHIWLEHQYLVIAVYINQRNWVWTCREAAKYNTLGSGIQATFWTARKRGRDLSPNQGLNEE